MNGEPSLQYGERIWSRMRPLLDELLAAPRSPRVAGKVPAVPGIYLFSHEGYRYVGQTRNCATAWRSTRVQAEPTTPRPLPFRWPSDVRRTAVL